MVVKYGGGGLLMFFKPFTKGSWGLSNIFLITVHSSTFVTVDDPTFPHHRIFILRGHQEVFDGGTSSKVYLHTIVAALFLDWFTQPPIVGTVMYGLGMFCCWVCLSFFFFSFWVGKLVSSLKYLFCYGENLTLHYGKQNEKPTYTIKKCSPHWCMWTTWHKEIIVKSISATREPENSECAQFSYENTH